MIDGGDVFFCCSVILYERAAKLVDHLFRRLRVHDGKGRFHPLGQAASTKGQQPSTGAGSILIRDCTARAYTMGTTASGSFQKMAYLRDDKQIVHRKHPTNLARFLSKKGFR